MNSYTVVSIILASLIGSACKQNSSKKNNAPTPTPYYQAPPNSDYTSTPSIPLNTTGTMRIEVIGNVSGTALQPIVGQETTWTFRAISGVTGGQAAIHKLEPSPASGMKVDESNTDTGTIVWKPKKSDQTTGQIIVTARDIAACTARGETTCMDFNTPSASDLSTTYTWQFANSASSSPLGSAALAGFLIGGLSGLIHNNAATGINTGVQVALIVAASQAAAANTGGIYGVPYGNTATNPYGIGQYPSTNYVQCQNYTTQFACQPYSPSCYWNGLQCVPGTNTTTVICANYRNNSDCVTYGQGRCTWQTYNSQCVNY